MNLKDNKQMNTLLKEAVSKAVKSAVSQPVKPLQIEPKKELIQSGQEKKRNLEEAAIAIPKPFVLKTESTSNVTKQNHFELYRNYVDSFNKVSSNIDIVPKEDANNPNNSTFRRLKLDEQHNLNGVKFHELFFANVGDKRSEVRMDSVSFIRLERDWGTFENWQLDFRACGMAATEGWAVCFFDPFKKRYFNTLVEKHTENVPVMGIPVLVVDTWHHAWFRDYPGEKMAYLNAMMKEINWDVVEARMEVAEGCRLDQIYNIQPIYAGEPLIKQDLVPNAAPLNSINSMPTKPGDANVMPLGVSPEEKQAGEPLYAQS